MKKTPILLTLLSAVAYGQNSTPEAQEAWVAISAECSFRPYTQYGACVQEQFDIHYPAWRSNVDADLLTTYVSWNQTAAQHVTAGEMGESDAKTEGTELLTRLRAVAAQRAQARLQASQQAEQQRMAAEYQAQLLQAQAEARRQELSMALLQLGSTLIQAGRPPPAPITCTTFGNRIITTTCN